MKWQLVAGISLVACAAALPAHAQDVVQGVEATEDDRITVTATRQPVAIDDAPATVSVIGAQQIADELATDIKDLVRYEPGVTVPRGPTRFGAALGVTGRGGNEGFIIRGIGGNRVLIQVDGVRVPDGFTFGAQSAGRGDYVDLG
ncbi:MAG: TonB-dependent hemoglobin/transferrin/lactoferrin family receptor, partial [Sphingomonadales bacterium]